MFRIIQADLNEAFPYSVPSNEKLLGHLAENGWIWRMKPKGPDLSEAVESSMSIEWYIYLKVSIPALQGDSWYKSSIHNSWATERSITVACADAISCDRLLTWWTWPRCTMSLFVWWLVWLINCLLVHYHIYTVYIYTMDHG